jgi:hypothetical protein
MSIAKKPAKKPADRARSRRPQGARSRAKLKKWSGKVTRDSDALDLKGGVFKKRSARDIAVSLKQSAEQSDRRKAAPLRSAMSMLTFYMNRAGKNLSESRLRTLEKAKEELRRLFRNNGKEP